MAKGRRSRGGPIAISGKASDVGSALADKHASPKKRKSSSKPYLKGVMTPEEHREWLEKQGLPIPSEYETDGKAGLGEKRRKSKRKTNTTPAGSTPPATGKRSASKKSTSKPSAGAKKKSPSKGGTKKRTRKGRPKRSLKVVRRNST